MSRLGFLISGIAALAVSLSLSRSHPGPSRATDGPPDSCVVNMQVREHPGDEDCRSALWARFPSFPDKLCAALPQDVDLQRFDEEKREHPDQLAGRNRLVDMLAWQTLIALQWPVDECGAPRPEPTDGDPSWMETWKTEDEIFLPDGSPRARSEVAAYLKQPDTLETLHNQDTYRSLNNSEQPDGFQLWDQNGNEVYYQTLFSPPLVKRIREDALYSVEGQAAYLKEHPGGFTATWSGQRPKGSIASIAIKLAWKILDETKGDIPGRFIVRKAYITDKQTRQAVLRTFGLVGVNLMMKTFKTSQQWYWAAFEHVDNLDVDELETHEGKPLKPLFHDPGCPLCPVNVRPDPDTWPVKVEPWVPRTQVLRLQPIAESTAALNREVRELLKASKLPLQYYELVGTQWATDPTSEPGKPGSLEAITNESGGKPNRAFLVNTVMETDMQQGNRSSNGPGHDASRPSPLYFQTSSCMGCHFNASLAMERTGDETRWGPAGSGDFLWSFRTRTAQIGAPRAPLSSPGRGAP